MNGANLSCLCEPRALAVGLRRILTTFSWPTASARGSKPVPFVSDTFFPLGITPQMSSEPALHWGSLDLRWYRFC